MRRDDEGSEQSPCGCDPAHAHLWQEAVVALQQQRAQLCPAQVLQLVLLQDRLIVIQVQLVGEDASSPAVEHTHTCDKNTYSHTLI